MGLFKPAWQTNNFSKAQKEVENENDQAKLTEIALKAPDDSIRAMAVKKIVNPSVLAAILKNDSKVAYAVITNTNLTDQTIIGEYLKNTGSADAARRLTNQSIIADILTKENKISVSIRNELIEKVADQSILRYIADNAKADYGSVKDIAVSKLTDQSALIEIAKKDINTYTGRTAAKKITNPAVLAEVAISIRNNNTCWSGQEIKDIIIDKLSDQKTLVNLARKAENSDVRILALHKITDNSILTDIARSDIKLACALIEKLHDISILTDIVQNDSFGLDRGSPRIRAYDRIMSINPNYKLNSKFLEVKEKKELYESLDGQVWGSHDYN